MGLGNRLEVLEEDATRYRELLKARLFHQVWVVVGLALVKISICLFLLRLVEKKPYNRKLYTWFLWSFIAFMTAFTVASVLTLVSMRLIFSCSSTARADISPLSFAEQQCLTRSFNVSLLLPHGNTPYVRRPLE